MSSSESFHFFRLRFISSGTILGGNTSVLGYSFQANLLGSAHSTSKILQKYVKKICRLTIARFQPKHFLLPKPNGAKEKGLRFLPSTVRYNGSFGSNLSGRNSYGLYHSSL